MKQYEVNTDLIAKFMAENNLNIPKFCRLCHITPLTFKKFLGSNTINPRSMTVFKIAAIMNVSVFDLFRIVQ